jgi:hypothetical protein
MSTIPSGTRFIGISENVNLTERKSAVLNAETQSYTIQDIADTVNGGSSGVVTLDGDQNIRGTKTFDSIGKFTNVVVKNSNTGPTSTALTSITSSNGIGISSISSGSAGLGLIYVGIHNTTTVFSVNRAGDVTGNRFIMTSPLANDFANDLAAAAGGVPVGGMYHTAGVAKIRLT